MRLASRSTPFRVRWSEDPATGEWVARDAGWEQGLLWIALWKNALLMALAFGICIAVVHWGMPGPLMLPGILAVTLGIAAFGFVFLLVYLVRYARHVIRVGEENVRLIRRGWWGAREVGRARIRDVIISQHMVSRTQRLPVGRHGSSMSRTVEQPFVILWLDAETCQALCIGKQHVEAAFKDVPYCLRHRIEWGRGRPMHTPGVSWL